MGTNTRLRAHLGLVVPKVKGKEKLFMRVGNETVGWKPGKWTIIDDSFEHEIVNDTDEPRLILLVDLIHPGITNNDRDEFNWDRTDIKKKGLERADIISSGFPP